MKLSTKHLIVCLVTVLISSCAQSRETLGKRHLERGLADVKANKLRAAIIEFKIASQNLPAEPEPLYQLGMACLAARDGKCAMDAFDKTLRLNQDHEGALIQMGRMDATANQPVILATAADLLGRLLQKHPANKSVRYALATVEVKLGRPEEALANFDSALELSIDSIDDIRLPIGAATRRRDFDLARTLVAHAVAKLPRSAELAIVSAVVAKFAGQHDLAKAETERALSLNPAMQQALELSIEEEIADNEPEKAEATARQLAAIPDSSRRTAHADLLASRGKADEALQEYESLRTKFPDDATIQTHEIGLLIRKGKPAEARTLLDKLLGKNPKRSDLLILRTGLSLDEGALEAAGKDIATLHELKVQEPGLFLQEARYYADRGEREKQGEALSAALRLNPRLTGARLRLAALLTEIGKASLAIQVLDGATDRERTTPQVTLSRSIALMASGDWEGARKAVDESLRQNRTIPALVQDAAIRMHSRDLQGAEKTIQEVLAKDPGTRPALAQKAAIWQSQKKTAEFLTWIEEFAGRNPGNLNLQLFTGELLRDAGHLPAARHALELAAKAGAGEEVRPQMAMLEIREGKLAAAIATLEEAIRQRDSAYNRSLLADVYLRQSDWAGAEEQLRAAIRMAPRDAKDMIRLAAVISNSPARSQEATLYAERALAAAPGIPALESAAGWVYYKTKRYPDAVQHLTASLKATDNPTTRYRLAAACKMAGDDACATTQYRAALKQNPSDPMRSEAEHLLEGRIR